INAHLAIKSDRNPIMHLFKTLTKPDHVQVFLATVLLATGGFMLMPFGSAFSTNNLQLRMEDLPILYGVTGVFSFLFGPIAGKMADRFGKYSVFVAGTLISMIVVAIYTNLGPTSLWFVCMLNVILFAGITARIISASTLISAVPLPQDRGAFMSINSSIQQISGGVAALLAGRIVYQSADGNLQNYDKLGYVVLISMVIAAVMMYFLNAMVKRKMAAAPKPRL
ncbi:MAG: MFS transporter, partial [Bacteroidia bacterium]